ncbi:ATP-binding protein [Sphingomonas sp. BIUV-7]|uniref:histidine kinase n=1 Tax=Sphingomonas natans TaxID=3063330 RepID=A0ABT8YA25_9SPHN|nr:ATP-binding protein [Sphingomonas sp. BIUV-7]MDO6415181.1 ATP-binding protein [Sphingomonas sp. BIUV-7]
MRSLKLTARRLSGPHRRIVTAAVVGIVLIAALSFGAKRWADGYAAAVSDVTAAQVARIHAGLLASELRTFRLLPLVLIEYPDVHAVLEGDDPEVTARLNGKLELLAARTNAAVIYVMRPDGRTIAASNWRRQDSFVGHDYGFRPYFGDALHAGSAELFALGSSSGRPGLFIARRISSGRRPLGVIVVKVAFDRLEAAWARQAGATFVTDRDGVVIITSRPEWRFHAVRPLSPEKVAAAARSRQFGRLPIRPIDLAFDGASVHQSAASEQLSYRAASIPVPLAGGELRFLQPLAPAAASANASARLAILAGVIVVGGVIAVMLRSREKVLFQVAARRTLESEVTLRTAELTEVNRRLIEESREREQADRSLRSAREELAQANRLGSIGQITAGVAHEINQPVAAIRTFAENAGQFLDRGSPERARANLDLIVDLTARIGTITAELRAFARRGAPMIGAIEVGAAIDGALLLMGDRIRSQGVTLDRSGRETGVRVVADRVGLEQVLINLIQNGLEALDDRPEPRLRISVELEGEDRMILEVVDNGPGVPPELEDQIFTPFVTGRPDGLGLGLGIARDIAREFGGELLIVRSALGGAGFQLNLRRA